MSKLKILAKKRCIGSNKERKKRGIFVKE